MRCQALTNINFVRPPSILTSDNGHMQQLALLYETADRTSTPTASHVHVVTSASFRVTRTEVFGPQKQTSVTRSACCLLRKLYINRQINTNSQTALFTVMSYAIKLPELACHLLALSINKTANL
jgi:hypothetical protein